MSAIQTAMAEKSELMLWAEGQMSGEQI